MHDVSLNIRTGEIVTVIGPNGAGKTTLLCGADGPAAGRAARSSIMGQRQGREREVETLVATGMTLVPEKRELFAEMSVEDNLLLGAFDRYRAGHRDQLETMDEVFELFPRLEERRDQMAGTLSGGERQMLAMGRALMAKPKLLMLDEPSLGLAPLIIREIFRIIAELKQDRRRHPAGRAERPRRAAGRRLRLRAGNRRSLAGRPEPTNWPPTRASSKATSASATSTDSAAAADREIANADRVRPVDRCVPELPPRWPSPGGAWRGSLRGISTRLANRRRRRHLARCFTYRRCRPFAWRFAISVGPGLRRRLLNFALGGGW